MCKVRLVKLQMVVSSKPDESELKEGREEGGGEESDENCVFTKGIQALELGPKKLK